MAKPGVQGGGPEAIDFECISSAGDCLLGVVPGGEKRHQGLFMCQSDITPSSERAPS